ncbi:MAG: hypothetical protein JRG88_13590 [Deltaproteobacteria bacterium]|nr:hypothetical protein [Deltaproteobacteria bacterium]
MIVRFGLDFDTLLAEIKETRFGKVTVGPEGLLSLLETQLGISLPKVSPFKRMVQYRLCLQQIDSPERFYHASFGVDPVAVSRTLLNWRDQLYCAGWNGAFPETASRRLKDLSHVEKEASVRVAPGRGQRLQSVIRALKDQKTGIEKIELIDPPSDYPCLWQKVLSHFKTETLFIDDRPPPERPASDLARLQRALESIPRKKAGHPAKSNGKMTAALWSWPHIHGPFRHGLCRNISRMPHPAGKSGSSAVIPATSWTKPLRPWMSPAAVLIRCPAFDRCPRH